MLMICSCIPSSLQISIAFSKSGSTSERFSFIDIENRVEFFLSNDILEKYSESGMSFMFVSSIVMIP